MISSFDEYLPGEDSQPIDEIRQAIALTFVESIDRILDRYGSGLERLEDLRNDIKFSLSTLIITTP